VDFRPDGCLAWVQFSNRGLHPHPTHIETGSEKSSAIFSPATPAAQST
jgi:hypothetical protein